MSLLSILTIPVLSAFTAAEENVVFARQNQQSSSAGGSSAPASSAASGSPSATQSGSSATGLPNVSATSSGGGITSGPGGAATITLPSISGAQTYSYPPPSVPPTANAPFMQKSTLPNGTVFICVGSIIGGFFVAVFAWRAWAVWALHRRMNAANVEYVGVPSAPPTIVTGSGLGYDRKSAVLRKSGTNFYGNNGGNGYDMGELGRKNGGGGGGGGRGGGDGGAGGSEYNSHRSHRGGGGGHSATDYAAAVGGASGGTGSMTKGAAAARQSSLFFSPTAGAGAHGTAAQRASSYLPAGFYAAGSTAAGSTVVNANSTSDLSAISGSRSQLGLADFQQQHGNQRQSYGYKDSPLLRPQSNVAAAGGGLEPPSAPFGRHSVARSSTGSLGTTASDRAPSAYLEDLFNTRPTETRGSDERRRY